MAANRLLVVVGAALACQHALALSDSLRVNKPFVPFKLEPLRWGTVRPRGWIRDWAMAARNGAVSPVHAAFANVQNGTVNGWRGGRPPSDGFWDEDSAYWIDGMTRMGLVLGDDELLRRVQEDWNHVIRNPIDFHNTWRNAHDLSSGSAEGWVRSVYSRGMLAGYDGTGNKTLLDFLTRMFSNYTAANSNSDRSLTQIEALLEGHAYGAPRRQVDVALAMMSTNPAATGWADGLANNPACFDRESLDADGSDQCQQHYHGVSFNEISKLHAMAYSWNGNASYLNTSLNAYKMMVEFDLQVHGVNSADEQLNGISPNVGTETCDVSDFTYSNEWLLRITGNGRVHGDRLEKAFHNAAPGAINRTFTGHLYYQNPNLVRSSLDYNCSGGRDFRWQEQWYHNPPCCTGNQARLLPNYIHHMAYGTPNNGIAITMYGPNEVRAPVGADDTVVTLTQTTDYPFADDVTIDVTTAGGAGARFELLLRIPGWCDAPSISVNGENVPAAANDDGFARVDREWKSGDRVQLTLPAELTAAKRVTFANGWAKHPFDPKHPWMGSNATSNLPFCVVERGSLTFALPLEADPDGRHGFAVDCDASNMRFVRGKMPSSPWDWPLAAPVSVKVQARPFDWPDVGLMPPKPIAAGDTTGPVRELELVPYGNAKVFHISMFPYLE